MATIPIEVIVQDAEAPIVPSEDGTNTNITVPDTGTISSNGDTSSSVSIILPAILLVLAIGSIVAILIHKYRKQKKDKTSKKEKLAVATSSTIAILAVTVLIGNLVLPATKAATSDIEDGITPAEDKVSIIVTRDGGVAETSIESTATITSTSDFGYKVLLSMAEGVETSNLYLNGDETSEHYIAPVEVSDDESEAEGTVLTDNTWGYALAEDGEYAAIPLLDNAVTIAQGSEPVEDESLSIYYGVKVSSDLPAGTYSGGEVEYSLVSLEPTISTLTYMQDFAKLSEAGKASVLNSIHEETTYTLKDQRDNQDYTIAKLKDGKVWMTKNLNLSGGTEITSDLSDVPENYILPIDGGFQEGNKLPASSLDGSDDVMAYVYNTGNNTTDCSESGCYSYYSWAAATANSGLGIFRASAPYSICPKGWKLPTGGMAVDVNSDFYQLAVSYGMEPDNNEQATSIFYEKAGPNTVANFNLAGFYSISSFNRGYGADSGYYWSSYIYDNSSIQLLGFQANYVGPFNSSSGGNKLSVRCLVY